MHIPVLLNEIIEQIESNKNYVDCTLGFGGHSKEILKKNRPNGKVLGIEIDKEIFEKTIKDERLIAVNDSYVNLEKDIEMMKLFPDCKGKEIKYINISAMVSKHLTRPAKENKEETSN